MTREQMEEMKRSFEECKADIMGRDIFLFGHCEATLCLADFLMSKGIIPRAILDNSTQKHGIVYRDINVVPVEDSVKGDTKNATVLIVTRFYEAMNRQLRDIGFNGSVIKLIDFNTYAEYSRGPETVARMEKRLQSGILKLREFKIKYEGSLLVFCPFNALGDIYFCMSYLPAFMKLREYSKVTVFVPSRSCAEVAHLFEVAEVEVMPQKELDAVIQAVIYLKDIDSYIAHQDRPYVVNLHKALLIKKISLEKIYCCGVFGLPEGTEPAKPKMGMKVFQGIESIPEGKAVIFSPYAKSVIAIDPKVWKEAVSYYSRSGFKCFTNVVGDEKPLDGTEAISPSLMEMRSVVERAGTFVGIRSGLCDILREAKAKKIVLYPDYNYCDTKWKAIEIYWIDQFDHNLLVTEEIEWVRL